MRGEFMGVWTETWREIWLPLFDHAADDDAQVVEEDVFCELYRALAPALKARPSLEALADIIDDKAQSRHAFMNTRASELAGEPAAVAFFEAAHEVLDDFGGDALSNRYFNLLEEFVGKFSLRYDLRRPCMLCPTLPGMFAGLVRELDALSRSDQNIAKRLRDSREAVQDLRWGLTEGRVSSCVMKQVMVLEAVAAASESAAGTDLAALCKSIDDWPHPAVRQALLSLYGFASDFPGVRHGTPSDGMKRDIDARDMVAMSILLTGFAPYLSSSLDADVVYRGA
jgi:hypothetical protein